MCLCICAHLSWLTWVQYYSTRCQTAPTYTKPAFLNITARSVKVERCCSPRVGCVHTEQVFQVSSGHWKDAPVAPLLHSFLLRIAGARRWQRSRNRCRACPADSGSAPPHRTSSTCPNWCVNGTFNAIFFFFLASYCKLAYQMNVGKY